MGQKLEPEQYTASQHFTGFVIMTILGLGMLGWAVLGTLDRALTTFSNPDMNQDGAFTISDLPQALCTIAMAAGDQYQVLLAGTGLGQFLEMSATNPVWYWSLPLTIFSFWIALAWCAMAGESIREFHKKRASKPA